MQARRILGTLNADFGPLQCAYTKTEILNAWHRLLSAGISRDGARYPFSESVWELKKNEW